MSNFVPIENQIGIQPIAATSTVQNHPLGHVVRAFDTTLGEGEFIYLKGIGSTVIGSLVTYDVAGGITALSPNTANLAQSVAVAMSANVASSFGWYQISGPAVIKKTAVKINPSIALFQSTTTGRVRGSAASGKQLVNSRSTNLTTVTTTTSTISAILDRPFLQGAVT